MNPCAVRTELYSKHMSPTEAAKTLRTMTTAERSWVKDLTENKAVPWEQAVPYVLSYRGHYGAAG